MDKYDFLNGDNFTLSEIENWFNNESRAYEKVISIDKGQYKYGYHALNKILGFNNIPKQKKLKNILCFGGGYAHEILPIIDQVENIYVIEPSKKFRNEVIKNKVINYIDPRIDGKIVFEDGFFDLITCFGVLMYIPNVSNVLNEFVRCLNKDGYLLIREPINGTDSNSSIITGFGEKTRGIPLQFFKNWISRNNFKKYKISTNRFGPLAIILRKLNFNPYNSSFLTYLDIVLCKISQFNYHYYRKSFFNRISPGSTFIFIQNQI